MKDLINTTNNDFRIIQSAAEPNHKDNDETATNSARPANRTRNDVVFNSTQLSKRVAQAPVYNFNCPLLPEENESRLPYDVLREIGKYLSITDINNVARVRKNGTYLRDVLWDWQRLGWNNYDDFRSAISSIRLNDKKTTGFHSSYLAENIAINDTWGSFVDELKKIDQIEFVRGDTRSIFDAVKWVKEGRSLTSLGVADVKGTIEDTALLVYLFAKKFLAFDFEGLTLKGKDAFYEIVGNALPADLAMSQSQLAISHVPGLSDQSRDRVEDTMRSEMRIYFCQSIACAWLERYDDVRMLNHLLELLDEEDRYHALTDPIEITHFQRKISTNSVIGVAVLYNRTSALRYMFDIGGKKLMESDDLPLAHLISGYLNLDAMEIYLKRRLEYYPVTDFNKNDTLELVTDGLTHGGPLHFALASPLAATSNLQGYPGINQRMLIPVVEFLINKGALCQAMNEMGLNAFHVLAGNAQNMDVTRLMLNSCFTLTTRAILLTSETKDGRIALHFAAENAAPNLEFLEFLMSTDAVLTLGAATLHCDVKKDTPLHVLALESGRVDAAEILMKNLSSEQLKTLLTMKNQKGRTVADVAISNGNSKLHEFVQSKLRQLE
jgi:hypothetical protein